MKVVTIARDPAQKQGFTLCLDDGASIAVTQGVLDEYFLYPGKEISEDDIAAMRQIAAQESARKRAQAMLSRRPMSCRQLIERLVAKGEERDTAKAAADWLVEIGRIDDAAYAALLAEDYAARGYGKFRIEQEFWKRGIDKEYWEDALAQIPEDTTEIDRFVQRKLGGAHPDYDEEKRLSNALYRRGFTWEEIRAAIRRYRDEMGEE